MTGRTFDDLLLNSIDEALTSLGESVRQSIYFHIENKFYVPRKDIPGKLGQFQDGLEKIFGTGARFIEILIMKNLHSRIGTSLEMDQGREFEFVTYVAAAEKSYLKK